MHACMNTIGRCRACQMTSRCVAEKVKPDSTVFLHNTAVVLVEPLLVPVVKYDQGGPGVQSVCLKAY